MPDPAPELQDEIDRGLRELRLDTVAQNRMCPVRLELLVREPGALAIRVTMSGPDLPAADRDTILHIAANGRGTFDFRFEDEAIPQRDNEYGVWLLMRSAPGQMPSFMWCVRRQGSADGPIGVYIRWMNGRMEGITP